MPTNTYLAGAGLAISRYQAGLRQDTSWAATHAGNAIGPGGFWIEAMDQFDPTYEIYRPEFVIDTSDLAGKTLTDARINFYPIAKWNTDLVSIMMAYDSGNVYPSDAGNTNDANFNIAEYDVGGVDTLAVADIVINNWYHVHVPTAAINKTGKTRFILLFNIDFNNTGCTVGSINKVMMNLSTDDGGGVPNRGPYLEVDYNAPAGGVKFAGLLAKGARVI